MLLIDAETGDTILSFFGETAVEWDLTSLPTTQVAIVAVAPSSTVNRVRFQYLGYDQNEGRPVRTTTSFVGVMMDYYYYYCYCLLTSLSAAAVQYGR